MKSSGQEELDGEVSSFIFIHDKFVCFFSTMRGELIVLGLKVTGWTQLWRSWNLSQVLCWSFPSSWCLLSGGDEQQEPAQVEQRQRSSRLSLHQTRNWDDTFLRQNLKFFFYVFPKNWSDFSPTTSSALPVASSLHSVFENIISKLW